MKKHLLITLFAGALLGTALTAQAENTSTTQAATTTSAQGTGVIKRIDSAKAALVIAHQPIKSLDWPAMTMSFKVTDAALLKGLAAGNKVAFTLQTNGNEMAAVITAIKPVQ